MPNKPRSFRPGHSTNQSGKPFAKRGSQSQSYQSWYQSAAWKAIRPVVLARDCYLCQPCLRKGITRPVKLHTTHADWMNQAHADHKEPHRGVWERFIDIDGIETNCGLCHRQKSGSGK